MYNIKSFTFGFQFFLTLGDDIDYLDGKHTVFGEVSEGLETLDKLNDVFVDQENRPYKDVRWVQFGRYYIGIKMGYMSFFG